MSEEIDFNAEHPKADMSGVDRIIVNGKVYLAANKVSEIIDAKIRDSVSNTEYIEESETPIYKALMELRAEFIALKGGEQE